jgi:small multidrug resistance family-3 protein
MTQSVVAFIVAAVLEIAGCFSFWLWLRDGKSPVLAVVGVLSLTGFAVILTRADAAFAGRAYAAYGGIYIAASLGWLMVVEHQLPTLTDIGGATLAICGALLILGFAR